MHLASYIAHGRTSFGAVVGEGVVDFRVRFGSRFANLVDFMRADALDEGRAVLARVRPKVSEQLDYEGEIAMVIGREGRHVPKGRARDYILGYTLCNEGTVRDW